MRMTDRPLGWAEPEAAKVLRTRPLWLSVSQQTPSHFAWSPGHFSPTSPTLHGWIALRSYNFSFLFLSSFSQAPSLRGMSKSHWFQYEFRHKVEKNKEKLEHWCGPVSGSWPYTELPLALQENSWIQHYNCNTKGLFFLSLLSPHPPFLIQLIRTLQKWQEVHLHFYQKVSKKPEFCYTALGVSFLLSLLH